MKKPVSIVLAVIGASIALAGYMSRPSQAQAPFPIVCPTWPPKPDDIVVLDRESLEVPANGIIPIYAVPQDKWLVLTNIELGANPSADFFSLVEDAGGTVTEKRNRRCLGQWASGAGGPYISALGIPFRPGSKVAIKNNNTSSPWSATFSMTGYLADP